MFRLDDFLGCFFQDDETVHVRGLEAKGYQGEVTTFTRSATREQIRKNSFIQMELKDANERYGMYFVPNSGGFLKTDIRRTNAVFCEIDDRPISEQHELFDAHLLPSIRIETKKSIHAYWLLEKPLSVVQWERIQYGLIDKFKSDPGIKNENRLMRLPFFNHLTLTDEGMQTKRVAIHTLEPERRYGFDALHSAFPYTPPQPVVYDKTEFVNDTMEGIGHELRYRISLLPSYKVRDGKAEAEGICHNGKVSKTALFVNLRTGAIHCNAGCDFWRIANAFGLDKPVRNPLPMRQRTPQITETGKFLERYVNGQVSV